MNNRSFQAPRFIRFEMEPTDHEGIHSLTLLTPEAGDVAGGVYFRRSATKAQPGDTFTVEAGSAFEAGAPLATDAEGRAVEASGGAVVVAHAAEASAGAGCEVRAVWAEGVEL